jgi:sugar/nucleoside kinase (ribokinase family)
VSRRDWPHAERDLEGVGFLFASLEDVGGDPASARRWLPLVDLIALTRGRQGVDLIADEKAARRVLTAKRPEVDPTGAGDVFGAAFLARYHETRDVDVAARFGCAAASCAVEGVGTTAIPGRKALEARLELLPS